MYHQAALITKITGHPLIKSLRFVNWSLGLSGVVGFTCVLPLPGITMPKAVISSPVDFSCQESEAAIKAKGTAAVNFGESTIYIGYQQVSSRNKDPRLARFDRGLRVWCKTDYETTAKDSVGYGLLWDGSSNLYGVFSSTGDQGLASQDFRRFAAQGWLRSYGAGGGPQVAVIARIDPRTGTVRQATFLSALLTSGKSNTLLVNGLEWTGQSLRVKVIAWYAPRRVDRTRYNCQGSPPFNYQLEINAILSTVLRTQSDRCS